MKPYQQELKAFRLNYCRHLMAASAGNVLQAARMARLQRQNLYKLLARQGIKPAEYRSGVTGAR